MEHGHDDVFTWNSYCQRVSPKKIEKNNSDGNTVLSYPFVGGFYKNYDASNYVAKH